MGRGKCRLLPKAEVQLRKSRKPEMESRCAIYELDDSGLVVQLTRASGSPSVKWEEWKLPRGPEALGLVRAPLKEAHRT